MKERVNTKKRFIKKRALITKILIILCIILVLLIISYIILFILNNYFIKQTIKLEGTLGTIGIFSMNFPEMEEILDVSNTYIFSNNNQTVNIILTRAQGYSGTLKKVFILFNRTNDYCIYNLTDNFPAPINSYEINANQTDCGDNFTDVFLISARGIKNFVNLTQTSIIPDIDMQFNEYRINAINLSTYFNNLSFGDLDLTFFYLSSIPGIELKPSNNFVNTHNLDINVSLMAVSRVMVNITLNYPGIPSVISNNFYINVLDNNCTDSDGGNNSFLKGIAQNLSTFRTDYCINLTHVQEYVCNGSSIESQVIACPFVYYCNDSFCKRNISLNSLPEFSLYACNISRFNWYKNENYSFDIGNCFNDPNSDTLNYRYSPLDNSHISINLSGSTIKLVPEVNWIGRGSFYVYASDSINETTGIVHFLVKETNIGIRINTSNQTINQTIYSPIPVNLSITNPNPSGSIVSDFYGKTQTFFISNTVYDSLEWYLDEKLMKANSNTFEIKNLSVGNHTVEVRIRRGVEMDSKTWKVSIEKEETGRKWLFDAGWVMFILIIIVVLIIAGLLVWLFVEEGIKKNKRIGLDLQMVEGSKPIPDYANKNDLSKKFNIPK